MSEYAEAWARNRPPTYDRDALIAVIDSMHEGAAGLHWAEAEELPRVLGWPDGSDGYPDGKWIRARLDEVLR